MMTPSITDRLLQLPAYGIWSSTLLQSGMVLAVDGSVSVASFRAQVGYSFIITEDGYEQITQHPKLIEDVIL